MTSPLRWYPSKIDTWLAIILALAPVISLAAAAAVFAFGKGTPGAFTSTILLALIYGGLVFPMRYGITDDELVVRHGLIRQRIPLRDILEVHPTSSPLSSPALSLDRLAIHFGQGFSREMMISPSDKEGFLEELAARSGLQREGERLVRGAQPLR